MACPDVQAELYGYFGNCDASKIGFRSPFSEFLWSPTNRGGLQQVINPGPGKLKTAVLRYDQAILPSEVQSGAMSDITCTADTKRGDLTTSYEIDPEDILFIEEKWNPADFYYACRNNPEIIMGKIAAMMKALREATYKKTADDFETNALWGQWGQLVNGAATGDPYFVNGNAELEVKTKKDGTIDPYPYSWTEISNAITNTSYCSAPFLVGGMSLFEFFQTSRNACCASNGLALDRLFNEFGVAVAFDKYLQASSALGDPNLSLAIQPGALQMLYFNEYEQDAQAWDAIGGKAGRNYDSFVITDPISGIPMNMIISDNCRTLSIFIHTCTKLVALPSDMFAVGDDLEGVTFVNRILVKNV